MQENEPVIMQEEISEYDGGCAMTMWVIFLTFWCCLIFAGWLSGFRLLDVLWKSAVYCLGFCAVIGLVQITEYLLRQRIRILVTPSYITMISVRRFRGEKVRQIPVPAIYDIQSFHNKVVIFTPGKKYEILHFAGAERFAGQLRPLLRQTGADIPKTAQERYDEVRELTADWKRRQVERALMQQKEQKPPSVTVDEFGQPILPQVLTDEQAEGVFRPAVGTETPAAPQYETTEQQGTLQEGQ